MIRTLLLLSFIFALSACNDKNDNGVTFKPPTVSSRKASIVLGDKLPKGVAPKATPDADVKTAVPPTVFTSKDPLIQSLITIFSKIPYDSKLLGTPPIKNITVGDFIDSNEEIPLVQVDINGVDKDYFDYGQQKVTETQENRFLLIAENKNTPEDVAFMKARLNASNNTISFLILSTQQSQQGLIIGFRCKITPDQDAPRSIIEIQKLTQQKNNCHTKNSPNKDLGNDYLKNYKVVTGLPVTIQRQVIASKIANDSVKKSVTIDTDVKPEPTQSQAVDYDPFTPE